MAEFATFTNSTGRGQEKHVWIRKKYASICSKEGWTFLGIYCFLFFDAYTMLQYGECCYAIKTVMSVNI